MFADAGEDTACCSAAISACAPGLAIWDASRCRCALGVVLVVQFGSMSFGLRAGGENMSTPMP